MFSYKEVGESRNFITGQPPPDGYHHLALRRRAGTGHQLFSSIGDAILGYEMHRGAKVFESANTPYAVPGTDIHLRIGLGRCRIHAATRVVYVLNEPTWRGFAYGTVSGHPECGEELFAAHFEPVTGEVSVMVAAFSRPATWYTRCAGPAGRLMQRTITQRYLRSVIDR